jgi:hypothetical protein
VLIHDCVDVQVPVAGKFVDGPHGRTATRPAFTEAACVLSLQDIDRVCLEWPFVGYPWAPTTTS